MARGMASIGHRRLACRRLSTLPFLWTGGKRGDWLDGDRCRKRCLCSLFFGGSFFRVLWWTVLLSHIHMLCVSVCALCCRPLLLPSILILISPLVPSPSPSLHPPPHSLVRKHVTSSLISLALCFFFHFLLSQLFAWCMYAFVHEARNAVYALSACASMLTVLNALLWRTCEHVECTHTRSPWPPPPSPAERHKGHATVERQ